MATAAMSTNWGFQIALFVVSLLATGVGVMIGWLICRRALLSRADGQLAARLRKGYGSPVVFGAKLAVATFVSTTLYHDAYPVLGNPTSPMSPVVKYSICIPIFISFALMMRVMQRAAARADAEVGKSEA